MRAGQAVAACVLLSAGMRAPGQPKRIYLASNDHTDLFWTADLRTCQKGFVNMIDYYLNRADATDSRPAAYQARFCCDGNYWMWVYEKHRSREQFLRLIRRIKDGHITVNLAPLCVSPGGMPAEAVIRGMYYPGRIERQHGVRFLVAHSCENPTYPLGLASLWAGSGARYAWGGNFGGDTRIPAGQLRSRKHEIFWWVGRDGRKVLMKWPSLVGGDNIGGYAEARRPAETVEYLTTNTAFLRRYPYPVASAFGKGWDDLETLTEEFETVAAAKTRPGRQVYVSNQVDFFRDFEKTCGSRLPRVTESYGNEWDLYLATLAELSARVKRATERLRSAEALAVVVGLRKPGFMAGREEAREQAWINMGLYCEHDINMSGKGAAAKRVRLDWQVRLVREIEGYVNRLHDDGVAELGAMIPSGAGGRFFVFNPLGWERTDVADLPYGGPAPAHVVDLAAGREVPSQPLTVDGRKHLRILAEGVPAVGYKVFEVRKGAGRKFPRGPRVSGNVIENRHYRVAVSPRGAVTSLMDKAQGDREFVRSIDGCCINDLGPGGGNLVAENVGCVSATLRATAERPLAHTTRVTLFGDSRR
ncbi:MAG: glycoside hydrolase, partial [Phycisphaerae bacterium]